MHFVPKTSAEVFQQGTLKATEYTFDDPTMNFARIRVTGRYPEQGSTRNTKSKMCCVVLEGSGTLVVEDAPFDIEEGDACIIEPGERYYWDADVTLAITSTPAWTKEQTEEGV